MRGKRMQTLNPLGHPSRGLGPWRQRLQPFFAGSGVPASDVVVMRPLVSVLEPPVFGKPGGHLPHEPGRLKRADSRGSPRAGEVVKRGERGAVRQPRRGLHHIRQSATTPVRDSAKATRHPPKLRGNGSLILGRDQKKRLRVLTWTCVLTSASRGERGAGGACGVSARLLIRPSVFVGRIRRARVNTTAHPAPHTPTDTTDNPKGLNLTLILRSYLGVGASASCTDFHSFAYQGLATGCCLTADAWSGWPEMTW
jgi:hypothetical protein